MVGRTNMGKCVRRKMRIRLLAAVWQLAFSSRGIARRVAQHNTNRVDTKRAHTHTNTLYTYTFTYARTPRSHATHITVHSTYQRLRVHGYSHIIRFTHGAMITLTTTTPTTYAHTHSSNLKSNARVACSSACNRNPRYIRTTIRNQNTRARTLTTWTTTNDANRGSETFEPSGGPVLNVRAQRSAALPALR